MWSTRGAVEDSKDKTTVACAVFVSGFEHKLTYYIRTSPNINHHLKQLDLMVDNVFIHAIVDGHICTTDERLLLSLPVKKGGLAIPIFSTMAELEWANSREATKQLVEHIYNQDSAAPLDTEQLKASRRRIAKAKEEFSNSLMQQLRERMSSEKLRANDFTKMKGGSSWLTTLPLKSENFSLNQREFYDTLNLRYRLTPKYLPSTYSCGKRFDVDHAMSCMKGSFVHRRQNVRDLCATLLNQRSQRDDSRIQKERNKANDFAIFGIAIRCFYFF